jgi:hypothetical protein
MRKVLYKSLYSILLTLTNLFRSRLLSKYKIFLGTALLIIMSSCSKKEKEEEIPDGPTCYLPAEPQESVIPEPTKANSDLQITNFDSNN